MTRRLANWLKGYQAYSAEAEPPETFLVWSALSALASVAQNKVWIDQGHFTIYPNLYIVLVGPAGGPRKSTALNLSRHLVSSLPEGLVNLCPASLTVQQLIVAMSHKPALSIFSKEFSSLVGPSGLQMFHFLTEIWGGDYSGDDTWAYETKHQGSNIIENACLNILGCTTPSWIAEGMPAAVTEHGFTARTIFIFEEKRRFLNPRPSSPPADVTADLVRDLEHIASLEGEFQWSPEGGRLYDQLYNEIEAEAHLDHRVASYFRRKSVHVLKVAMLLHLAESDELVLEPRDLKVAMALLAQIESKMPRTFSAVGKYELAMDVERVYAQILTAGSLTRSDLIERNLHLGIGAVSEILVALEAMRRVEIDRKPADPLVKAVGRKGALGESRKSGQGKHRPSKSPAQAEAEAESTVGAEPAPAEAPAEEAAAPDSGTHPTASPSPPPEPESTPQP